MGFSRDPGNLVQTQELRLLSKIDWTLLASGIFLYSPHIRCCSRCSSGSHNWELFFLLFLSYYHFRPFTPARLERTLTLLPSPEVGCTSDAATS